MSQTTPPATRTTGSSSDNKQNKAQKAFGKMMEETKEERLQKAIKEVEDYDFADDINFSYDMFNEERAYDALTDPRGFLQKRIEEMNKIKDNINTKTREVYQKWRKKGYSRAVAKQKSLDYSNMLIEQEYKMLDAEYPVDLTNLAKHKTSNVSISKLKPEFDEVMKDTA